MNLYLLFLVASVIGVPIFVVLAKIAFKRSFLAKIMLPFVVYSLVQVLLGVVGGDLGITAFFWTVPSIIVVGLVFLLVLSRQISVPIKKVSELARVLSEEEGDLTVRLDSDRTDELGELNGHFNTFLERLSRLVAAMREGIEESEAAAEQAAAKMDTVFASAGIIGTNSQTVKNQVESQAASVAQMSSSLEQMSRTIAAQDEKIRTQSVNVAESSAAIEEMMASIRSIAGNLQNNSLEFTRLEEAVGAGTGAVSELGGLIRELDTQSESVLEANRIIKNLASKTNLLAMNAAIEAAHAGDSGRGFAVVAEEIRSLAELSNEQSKVIARNLGVLKQSIQTAVQTSQTTGRSFESIVSSVDTVTRIEREITHAVDEQSTGGTQILEALTSIRGITEEVHTGSTQMRTGSEEISNEMNRLLDITERIESSSSDAAAKAHEVAQLVESSRADISRNNESIRKVRAQAAVFTVQ